MFNCLKPKKHRNDPSNYTRVGLGLFPRLSMDVGQGKQMNKKENRKGSTDYKVIGESKIKESPANFNKDIKVSIFEKGEFKKQADFYKVIDAIKSGFFDTTINSLREGIAKGDGKWKDLKKQLPGFTPCATFDKIRQPKYLTRYNQLVVLDIDNVTVNVEEISTLTKTVNSQRQTIASFISPSGNGLKIFVRVNTLLEHHTVAFNQVANHYHKLLGIQIDFSGKDVTRLCFISSDERAYYNENADVFKVNLDEVVTTEIVKYNLSDDSLDIETRFQKIVELTKNRISFVLGNRNNFINLLANNCNRFGIELYQAIDLILGSEYCYDPKDEVLSTIKSAYKNINDFNKFPLNDLKENVANVAPVVQQKNATISKIKTFQQLAEEGKYLKPLRQIFGNYILEKSTTLFPSERGVGKSFLVMQLAIKIASGAQEFLDEPIQLNGNVLYLNHELGEHSTTKRMQKLLENENSKGDFEAFCFTSRSGLFSVIDEIREFCIQNHPVLIIIDNLRTALEGMDNENNKTMSTVTTEINKLKDEFNCAILIVHHTKKGNNNQLTNSDMQSGAGALTDLVDADFFLRKSGVDKSYRILKRVKSRECEEQDGAKLITMNPDTLWFEFVEEGVNEGNHVLDEKSTEYREKREAKIFDLIKQGTNDADISREVNVHRATVGRMRKRLV